MIAFWLPRLLIVGGAIALMFWGARSLDRYERALELDAWLTDDPADWTPPPSRGVRESYAFVDTLDEIRALPEVAA